MNNIITTAVKHRNAFFVGIAALVSVFSLSPAVTNAQPNPDVDFGLEPVRTEINVSTGESDARVVVVRLINLALTFLGLVAVILILWGGFKWMTAGGNDEQVGEAKKIIIASVIGLAIILSAYAIAQFFISNIGAAIDTGAAPNSTN